MVAVCGSIVVYSDSTIAGFSAGASAASVVWLVALATIEVSGTSTWRMGAAGEQWTGEELVAATPEHVRIVHAVALAWGDVDHVVVGPGGVWALETKWSSTKWSDRDLAPTGRITAAVQQATRNAREVRSRLAAYDQRRTVGAVVVVWGNVGDLELPFEQHGVAVVHGKGLREWLADSRPEVMSAAEVASAADGLERYVAHRDLGDAAIVGGSRFVDVGVGGLAGDVGAGVGGGIGGFVFGTVAIAIPTALGIRVVLAFVPVVVGLFVWRSGRSRWALGGLGGVVGSSVLLALVAAVALVDAVV